MVSSFIQLNREPNATQTKYQKKTHLLNPLKPKVASMACANQLVRIIFLYAQDEFNLQILVCKQSQNNLYFNNYSIL